MTSNTPQIRNYAYKYGLIYGAITIVFSLMLHIMDLTYSGSNFPQIFGYVLLAVLIIWAVVSFRKDNQGKLSVGQATKIGTATALISAIITVLYIIVFANVIEPDFAEKLGELTSEQLREKAPQLTEDQIAQQVAMQTKFFWVSYPFILIAYSLYGLVLGWITGLFTKKA
jgi:membrane protease YdiL (CAAX protease family)